MRTLLVDHLHPVVTETTLRSLFSNAGKLKSVRICRNPVTFRSMGFAYIKFARADDAEYAFHRLSTLPSFFGFIRMASKDSPVRERPKREPISFRIHRIVVDMNPAISITISHLMKQLSKPELNNFLRHPKTLQYQINEFSHIVQKMIIKFFVSSVNRADMMQKLSVHPPVNFTSPNGKTFSIIIRPQEIEAYMDSEPILFDRLAAAKRSTTV